jgi:hypothetical protein
MTRPTASLPAQLVTDLAICVAIGAAMVVVITRVGQLGGWWG